MESNFVEWQGENIFRKKTPKTYYIFHFIHFIKSLGNGYIKQYFHRF